MPVSKTFLHTCLVKNVHNTHASIQKYFAKSYIESNYAKFPDWKNSINKSYRQ